MNQASDLKKEMGKRNAAIKDIKHKMATARKRREILQSHIRSEKERMANVNKSDKELKLQVLVVLHMLSF